MNIRSLASSDTENYRSVLARTSAEDRYCRFFHVVNHFDLADLSCFVEPRVGMIGLLAEDDTQALGVAHAFIISPSCAEVSIVVAADARCEGVGRALLEHLVDALRARHVEEMKAWSLSGNSAFARLARSIGMMPTGPPGELMTWTLEVALT